ncbi:MAG: DUF2442 domain-containing protein [Nodosilinea sp. LVE1205-7]|jgi:hypothetical protein
MIEFTNQEVKVYDIRHLLENPTFAPLRQPLFFRTFQVEPGGYGIVWNDDIDLSEYELWQNSVTMIEPTPLAPWQGGEGWVITPHFTPVNPL